MKCTFVFLFQKAKLLAAKKEEGNKEFRSGHLQKAIELYTEALSIDPNNKFTNSKLYFNRATVLSKVCTQTTIIFILLQIF